MALERVLGKPRGKKFRTKKGSRCVVEKLNGPVAPVRENFFWDKLGLKAYCYNNGVVNCFAIVLKPSPAALVKGLFGGTLLIEGKPWLDVMKDGQDVEGIFRRVVVGHYNLLAEYDEGEPDSFKDIEIELAKPEDDSFFGKFAPD